MAMELNQQDNRLIVNGYLKSKNLRHIQLRSGGDAIVGSVDVSFDKDNQKHVERINVFAAETTRAGKTNPSYQSISKVENEFVAGDQGQADRIHVSGHVDYSIFSTKAGTVVKTLRKNGAFFSRISKDGNRYKDEARANVVLTVLGYEDEVKNGAPTGNKIIHNINVGYGDQINTIPNLKFNMKSLGKDIDTIVNTFPIGSTINTQIVFDDYAKVQKSAQQAHGFGNHEQMSVATQFVNNNLIDYIDVDPVSDTEKRKQALSKSQINHAKDLLKQKIQRVNGNSNQSKPANPFANNSGKTPVNNAKDGSDNISDDDLPF